MLHYILAQVSIHEFQTPSHPLPCLYYLMLFPLFMRLFKGDLNVSFVLFPEGQGTTFSRPFWSFHRVQNLPLQQPRWQCPACIRPASDVIRSSGMVRFTSFITQ